jgi:hypothetical protein
MVDSRLTGKAVPAFDAKINEFLKNEFEDDGKTMSIAVRNDAGEIYRTINATGLHDFLSVIGFLKSLRLIDMIEGGLEEVDGFDAIFVPPVGTATYVRGKVPDGIDGAPH